MPTVAASARETVCEDAALQAFAEPLLHVGWRRVMVTLRVKLACNGEFQPGLEVAGDGAVAQALFRMTDAIERATSVGTLVWLLGEGLATQRIDTDTELRLVDAILSGTHEPGAQRRLIQQRRSSLCLYGTGSPARK